MVGGFVSLEVWEEDTVYGSVWFPFLADANPVSYANLVVTKVRDSFAYLQAMVKLLPKGQMWNIPIGEPSDYPE